jgi:hypothetical protein
MTNSSAFNFLQSLAISFLLWHMADNSLVILLTYLLNAFPLYLMVSTLFFHFDHFTDSSTPWTSDQPVARPLPKYWTTQTQNKRIHTLNIHALSEIRTHDPSVRASEDRSCLRPRGYCDWLLTKHRNC